ncbi:MAG: cellulose synthase operon protein YhjQ/BcsQ [Candidatus Hadarchaeales archaeon]
MIRTVLGTKGGVGKSSIAIGISIALSKLGRKTLLIDGDMHVRSVELKLAPNMDHSLAQVLSGEIEWKKAVYACSLLREGKPMYPNLAVMPAGSTSLSAEGRLREWGEKFDGVLWSCVKKFDEIIIDTPASVSPFHLLLTAAGDRILYVCEPNDDSILATQRTCEGMKRLLDIPPGGVILNRVPSGVRAEIWKRKAEQIAPVLGVIPFDEQLDEAFRQNLPVDASYPDSRANLEIHRIAERLAKEKGKSRPSVGRRLSAAIEQIVRLVSSPEG